MRRRISGGRVRRLIVIRVGFSVLCVFELSIQLLALESASCRCECQNRKRGLRVELSKHWPQALYRRHESKEILFVAFV